MKLLRLKINDYFRSLQPGFEIKFFNESDLNEINDFMPYCLVGLNGSGKSNVLEALASIFYHIECIYLASVPQDFIMDDEDSDLNSESDNNSINQINIDQSKYKGFKSNVSAPDAFEIEYLIRVNWKKGQTIGTHILFNNLAIAHIKITKTTNEAPVIICVNSEAFDSIDATITRQNVKDILPDYIVGYSSGENEILSLPFFKMRVIHYDEYATRLVNELEYNFQPEGRLIFMDSLYSQSVFLANYLLQKEKMLEPIMNTIGIGEIKEFRLIINMTKNISNKPYEDNLPEDKRSKDYKTFPLVDLMRAKIDSLQNCSTCHYFDSEKGLLYLDFFVTEETKNAFGLYFGSALEFFWIIQMLFTLNFSQLTSEIKKRVYNSQNLYLHNDVIAVSYDEERIIRIKDFKIEKLGSRDKIYTKSLSDGEHQFLHSMGLCILFKDTKSLFLLDEPETHFNPEWRAKFVSTLRNCLMDKGEKNDKKEKNDVLREILITSHSPFIVSDCHEDNVLIFSKDSGSQKVTYTRPNFNTFGASVNKITMKVFGKTDTIGDLAKESFSDLYAELDKGGDKDKLAEKADRLLGDSVEKILLMKKIKDSKS